MSGIRAAPIFAPLPTIAGGLKRRDGWVLYGDEIDLFAKQLPNAARPATPVGERP
jgi:hypothetical protein